MLKAAASCSAFSVAMHSAVLEETEFRDTAGLVVWNTSQHHSFWASVSLLASWRAGPDHAKPFPALPTFLNGLHLPLSAFQGAQAAPGSDKWWLTLGKGLWNENYFNHCCW